MLLFAGSKYLTPVVAPACRQEKGQMLVAFQRTCLSTWVVLLGEEKEAIMGIPW